MIQKFQAAFEGIQLSLKQEKNLRIHILAAICAIYLGFYRELNLIEWLILGFSITLVITAELINTAIERVVDLCSPTVHPLAKAAKDIAAGAVLITCLWSIIVGVFLFLV